MEQMIATLREQIGRVRNNGARRRLTKALDKAMARKALREEVQRMRAAREIRAKMLDVPTVLGGPVMSLEGGGITHVDHVRAGKSAALAKVAADLRAQGKTVLEVR